jgi:hypothetical protein
MNWYKTARKGRWGGEEGDSHRNEQQAFDEEIELFNTMHREELAQLKQLFKDAIKSGSFDAYNNYIKQLEEVYLPQGEKGRKIIDRLTPQSRFGVKL